MTTRGHIIGSAIPAHPSFGTAWNNRASSFFFLTFLWSTQTCVSYKLWLILSCWRRKNHQPYFNKRETWGTGRWNSAQWDLEQNLLVLYHSLDHTAISRAFTVSITLKSVIHSHTSLCNWACIWVTENMKKKKGGKHLTQNLTFFFVPSKSVLKVNKVKRKQGFWDGLPECKRSFMLLPHREK